MGKASSGNAANPASAKAPIGHMAMTVIFIYRLLLSAFYANLSFQNTSTLTVAATLALKYKSELVFALEPS